MELLQANLDAIGFGFLIPAFFVVTGPVRLDALFANSE